MPGVLGKIKIFIKRILGLTPSQLPRTRAEFDLWFDDICTTYSLPNSPDYKQAVATVVMHLDVLQDTKSKSFFAKSIRKSQANQIAYNVIDEIRQADIARKKEEAIKLQAEAEDAALKEEQHEGGEAKVQA